MTDDTLTALFARILYPVRVEFALGRWTVEPVKSHAGVTCPLRPRTGPTLALALERLAADADAARAEGEADSARCDLLATKADR